MNIFENKTGWLSWLWLIESIYIDQMKKTLKVSYKYQKKMIYFYYLNSNLRRFRNKTKMSTSCLIAIKKQGYGRPSSLKQSRENDQMKKIANQYVRENFVVWSHAEYDGWFRSEGVAIWEFLRKFMDEWSDEKRREYVSSLDLIQEASEELVSKSASWTERLYRRSVYTKPFEERIKIPKFLEYMPCSSECGSMIFDIIEAKKGNVMTNTIDAREPFNLRDCEYAYIVDFDASEFHVMKSIYPPGRSSPLLSLLETIFKKQAISLIKKFKFSELPRTRDEFLESLRIAESELKSRDS